MPRLRWRPPRLSPQLHTPRHANISHTSVSPPRPLNLPTYHTLHFMCCRRPLSTIIASGPHLCSAYPQTLREASSSSHSIKHATHMLQVRFATAAQTLWRVAPLLTAWPPLHVAPPPCPWGRGAGPPGPHAIAWDRYHPRPHSLAGAVILTIHPHSIHGRRALGCTCTTMHSLTLLSALLSQAQRYGFVECNNVQFGHRDFHIYYLLGKCSSDAHHHLLVGFLLHIMNSYCNFRNVNETLSVLLQL